MSVILPWFRIPTWCALDEDPAVAAAAIHLLGRWHLGRHPAVAEMAKAWGWGWDRAANFMDEMWEWAGEHEAIRPPTARGKSAGGRPATARVSRSRDRLSTAHLRRGQGGSDDDPGTFRSPSCAPDLLPEKEKEIRDQDQGDPRERTTAPATVPDAPPPAAPPVERVPPAAPTRPAPPPVVPAGSRPTPGPVPRAADVRPAAQAPPRPSADELYGAEPAEWVDVGGKRVPGKLPMLLDGIEGGFARLGRLTKKLIGANYGDTVRLLRLPVERLRFQGHGLNDADEVDIEEVLRRRWGIGLGALAVAAAGPTATGGASRGAARPSFHDRYAAAAAELDAEAGDAPATDPPPRSGSIDIDFSEVPS